MFNNTNYQYKQSHILWCKLMHYNMNTCKTDDDNHSNDDDDDDDDDDDWVN